MRDVLANKQSRGAFGRARMEAIVQDGMPKGAYDFQYTLSSRASAPTASRSCPTSARCASTPSSRSRRSPLRDARTDDDKKAAAQRLRQDVLKHVSDIADKYLIAGETQDTALMFVPSESVYAEIHDGFDDVAAEGLSRPRGAGVAVGSCWRSR